MITLNSAAKLIRTPEVSATVTGVNIERMVDEPNIKKVSTYIVGSPIEIVLWAGAAYDAIGQWTDSDVTTKIQGLAGSGISPFGAV